MLYLWRTFQIKQNFDTNMNWLTHILYEPSIIQAVLVICLVSGIGLYLGKFKIAGISLGITFVFFTGIIAGHFGIALNADMLSFVQSFGLILFVYSLGLQVGPGFFSSLRKGGIMLNLMALAVVGIGLLMTYVLHWTTDISLSNMMGIFAGSVTNTPALGAAQQALVQTNPDSAMDVAEMALACAITYPLGVVGVILAVVVLRLLFSNSKQQHAAQGKTADNTCVCEFQITNPAIDGKIIKEVMHLSEKPFVISRLWREGKASIPHSETRLLKDDHLLITAIKTDLGNIQVLFGEQEQTDWNKEDIDWNAIDSQLVSKRVVVSKPKLSGEKLGSLRLRNLYNINITRINRAGIVLLPSPKLRLQVGDKLTIVGEAPAVNNVSKILGNEVKQLETPNLMEIFIGIVLGVMLGSVPIPIPGMSEPVTLGIAGGPIVMGILMGAFGSRFHLTTYTTRSANLMIRQLGIVIYLAGLGVSSGEHFFETLFRAEGLIWIGLGFALTMLPILIVGVLASSVFHIDYAKNVGMLCGSMTNPMALTYANTTVEGDEPSVAYATVYPLTMFIRVITAQMLIMFGS